MIKKPITLKIIFFIMIIFILSQCGDIKKEQMILSKEKYDLYKHYISPLPDYLKILNEYQHKKLHPLSSEPDKDFLVLLYNALSNISKSYSVSQCYKLASTDSSRKYWSAIKKKGIDYVGIDAGKFVTNWAYITPDFIHKKIFLNALLYQELVDKSNELSTGMINIEMIELISDNWFKRYATNRKLPKSKIFFATSLFCYNMSLDEIKYVKAQFKKLYTRYTIPKKLANKIGLPDIDNF